MLTKRTVIFRFGRFTDFAVRYLTAGRRVDLSCTVLEPQRLDGWRPWGAFSRRLTAPHHLHDLRLGRYSPSVPSFCTIWQVAPVRRSLVDVPLTEDGAVYLDERRTMGTLSIAADTAAIAAADAGITTFAPTEELVSSWNRGSLGTAVALETPDGTPPPGKLGIFSDGAYHFEAVKLSTLGRRLFYNINGDVLTTNGQIYISQHAA